MPWLIRGFASLFTRLMKISGAESLCASSNMFVGIESALVVQPYLKEMTRSEMTTILSAGMGTIASTVLALYVFTLQAELPTIAGHLISASFLSVPAAVIMAKLLVPETGEPITLGLKVKPYYQREENLILGGIVALLLAFLGIIALLDLVLGYAGGVINNWLGLNFDFSIKGILGYLFYPLTLIIGVCL